MTAYHEVLVNQPADASLICPVIVGRRRHIDSLGRLLVDVTAGSGTTIAISGEAGIGKSRLVAEMVRCARNPPHDLRVLRGHCFEPDSTLPYGPIMGLLRTLPAHEFADLIAAAPELGRIFPERGPNDDARRAAVDPEQEKRHLFAALAQHLVALAQKQPLLIAIEDLHWCDDTSLEFLLQFSRRVTTEAVLLVLTFRDDEAQPSLRRLLGGLSRERLAIEWPLARLDKEQVTEMISAIFGMTSAMHEHTLDMLYPLTEGNPFFIEEVLKSLISSGDVYLSDGGLERKSIDQLRIPGSIQDAVRDRTDRLPAETQRILTLAAVTGRRFDFLLLQHLAGLEEAQLLTLIKELIDAQLVVEENADQFSFRHALTQHAVYSRLLARERRSLHRVVARSMQEVYRDNLDARLDELAYHYYEAASWEEAYRAECRLSERAQTLHASRAVVEHATRAISSAHQLKRTPPGAVYRLRGQGYEVLGDFDAARADYERAFDASRRDGDRAAEWQSLIDLGFLWSVRDYERTGAFFRRASLLADAIADPLLRARSANRLGNWFVNVGRIEEGIALHDEALRIFASASDVQGQAETLDLLGMATGMLADMVRSVDYYRDAIELLRPLGPSAILCSSLSSRVTYSSNAMNDVTATAIRTNEDLLAERQLATEAARQVGGPAVLSYARWTTASALAGEGRVGEALALAHEGLRFATEVEHVQWMTGAAFTIGQTYTLVLAGAEAIAALEPAFERARVLGSAWWIGNCGSYLALAYVLHGDLDRAEVTLDAAWKRDRAPNALAERRVLWVSGILDLERKRPAEALDAAQRLIDTARGVPQGQRIPAVLHLKGEALAALGRPGGALAALEDAKAAALERRDSTRIWPIHGSLARLHRIARRPDDAAREGEAARTVIDAIGNTIDAGSVREGFLRRALGSLPKLPAATPARLAKQASGGLTGRESEVAVLIAAGKSNREIAEELILGERTIETHVGNVLSKLGFSSRSQIAAWAVETGLTKR